MAPALRLASASREPDADVKSGRMAQLAALVANRLRLSAQPVSVVELAASGKLIGRLPVSDGSPARSGAQTAQERRRLGGHFLVAEKRRKALDEPAVIKQVMELPGTSSTPCRRRQRSNR